MMNRLSLMLIEKSTKKPTTEIRSGFLGWAEPGLNRRPCDFQSHALPAELSTRNDDLQPIEPIVYIWVRKKSMIGDETTNF